MEIPLFHSNAYYIPTDYITLSNHLVLVLSVPLKKKPYINKWWAKLHIKMLTWRNFVPFFVDVGTGSEDRRCSSNLASLTQNRHSWWAATTWWQKRYSKSIWGLVEGRRWEWLEVHYSKWGGVGFHSVIILHDLRNEILNWQQCWFASRRSRSGIIESKPPQYYLLVRSTPLFPYSSQKKFEESPPFYGQWERGEEEYREG